MFETLGRVMLAANVTLKIECERCGHRAEWRRQDAFAIFGVDASPFAVRRRSRCVECGETNRVAVRI